MATLIKLFKKYQAQIAYLFFGGLTTVINLITFGIANYWWHWNYQVATVWAWIIAVLFAYVTNKLWVFSSKASGFTAIFKEMLSFFGFRILTLFFEMIIMFVGISVLHGNAMLVKIIDQIIVVVSNYFFSKWYIFKTNDI
ncbi:GtrA family protein [Furfurilactobacillus cerevisiae]|uniref:GtrA family protein n=1 Tax=Furfurilactobacillus rossiae TaxID=231049 RepID=UPI003B97D112